MKSEIKSNNAPAPIGAYVQAVKTDNFIFVSGQIPLNTNGEIVGNDIETQTKQVLENIKAILSETACSMENVVKATIYLNDMNNFSGMNKVYAEYFPKNPPARVAIEVRRLPKDVKIEIDVIAILP